MDRGGLRPAEAAQALEVPPSTLRLYSVRFGEVLSKTASTPVERGGGKPGFRIYSKRDLAVLQEGKSLLAKGLTYQESLEELRRRWARDARLGRAGLTGDRITAPDGSRDEARTDVGVDVVRHGDGGQLSPVPYSSGRSQAAPAGEGQWLSLASTLLASLSGAQAVAEEWRRIVEERNSEVAVLRERLDELEERRRRSWWRRLFGD